MGVGITIAQVTGTDTAQLVIIAIAVMATDTAPKRTQVTGINP